MLMSILPERWQQYHDVVPLVRYEVPKFKEPLSIEPDCQHALPGISSFDPEVLEARMKGLQVA